MGLRRASRTASERALILGATSGIAHALTEELAEAGTDLVLAARDPEAVAPLAADLHLRTGVRVDRLRFDALEYDALRSFPARVQAACGPFDLVVQVFGYLGDQRRAEGDTAEMLRILNTNFTAAAAALCPVADYLLARQTPAGIIALSSVAGDRGRQSNYLYGAAKGGLSIFLAGLRHRLAGTPVHVLTVKPGFVDTPMIQGLQGLFLVASPERVARDILRAYRRRQRVVYTPWFWRWILLLLRSIPEPLFDRLRI
ncbi:MAG: SDR family oxidoreductase [Candidatus Latescibacterota bacterium]